MKYSEFIQLKNIRERLVALCEIHRTASTYFQINHFPDFDVIKYEGPITKEYYFKNFWHFPAGMESVISVSFGRSRIYSIDNLKDMCEISSVPYDTDSERVIRRLYDLAPDILLDNDYGFEVEDIEEFKLYSIKINQIDNEAKKLIYDGTFFGDSDSIDPVDWAFYTEVTLNYIPNSNLIPLYLSLLGQSYILYREDRLTLAFFILFSAFECFINSELQAPDADEERSGRLGGKLEDLYQNRFSDISGHEIYQGLKPKFDKIKTARNDVAHGKKSHPVTSDLLEETYYFVLILILSYQYQISTFQALKELLKNPKAVQLG